MPRSLFAVALVSLLALQSTYADQRGAAEPKTAAEVYGQGVRETPRLSPAEEAAGFHLPDGFVAELVASEPQIAKPLNMAFDGRGRLWITDTVEYPYPAPAGTPARDSIKVLSDEDGDGKYETVKTFAEGLNIPIGILPVADGVICFSIPNLVHFKDTDGDGKCDEQKVLLGPFDTTRDTHGMINALRHGPDGWIYACHGFNNQSHVKAADGSEIHLISGNTFRFKADGSHVEQFTNGQVNPYGMTSDEFGNWFTADCHSKPVTMLVQGGYYESFGRPHDGLGFVPAVMDHLHGSTAICGITYYQAENFPQNFRHKFYSGNVMTSRINCNRFQVDRDRIQLVEEPDFMTSDDPWFRPVDILLGPDGALYVADFYNKIIGHYEVRLDHPERDRTSGRIWKIVYRGTDPTSQPLTKLKVAAGEGLTVGTAKELDSTNATRRQLALAEMTRHPDVREVERQSMRDMVGAASSPAGKVAALWGAYQLGVLNLADLTKLPSLDSAELKVARFQIMASLPRGQAAETAELRRLAREQLHADIPQVAIAAAGALAVHGQVEDISALVEEIQQRPASGAIVPHAMRIAVKRLMLQEQLAKQMLAGLPDSGQLPTPWVTLGTILPAVATSGAAEALLSIAAREQPEVVSLRGPALQLACKQMRPEFAPAVVKLLNSLKTSDAQLRPLAAALDEQTTLALEAFATLRAGSHAVPVELQTLLTARLDATADAMLEKLSGNAASKPLVWQSSGNRAWQAEDRQRLGKDQNIKVISSLPLGETYTGTRTSAVFACPEKLSFWLCGHDGPPNVPAQNKNLVRLVNVETNQTLMQSAPPRHDRLHQIQWDLSAHAGQPVRFECIDGDDGNAYAWLAVSDFSLSSLNPSSVDGGIARLTKLLESMGNVAFDHLQPKLSQLLSAPALADDARARLIAAVANARGRSLGKQLADAATGRGLASQVDPAIAIGSPADFESASKKLGAAIAAQLTLSQQTQVARVMIASAEGRRLLVQLVDEGHMAPQGLRTIKDLLVNADSDADSKRLAEISQAASAQPSAAEQAVAGRIAVFKPRPGDYEKGRIIYEKNCQNCHKLRGVGQLVGPQLDGVGPRGHERLAEDILLPNRNVDKAFRMSSILLEDERVVVGLVRETAEGELQLVGTDGKTQSIPRGEIAQRKDTTRSLMPDNFAELFNDEDLSHLLRYLTQPQ